MNLDISCFKERFSNRIEVAIIHKSENGRCAQALPLMFESINEGQLVNSSFNLSNTEAQKLMDQLWNVGLRPSEGAGSAGSLAATERHLKDMQEITFKTLSKILEK